MLKKQITRAECRCEFDFLQDGSVKKGTYHSDVLEFRTHLTVESPESDADIANIIRLAKRSCFAEVLVQKPVPLSSTYEVNGREFEVDL
jgi:hypothetical protein